MGKGGEGRDWDGLEGGKMSGQEADWLTSVCDSLPEEAY